MYVYCVDIVRIKQMKKGTPKIKVRVGADVCVSLKEQTIEACEILGMSLTDIIVEAFKTKVKEAQKESQKVSA